MLSDPLFWLLATIGVVMTGISKSGFAGGAGVVAVPLLALLVPVPIAAAIMLPLLLVMDARTVMLYRDSISSLKPITTITTAALLGVAIAGVAMAQLPTETLRLVLALICIAFAAWDRLTPLLGKLPGAAWIWGGTAGITSTLLHAGGPPISIYFLSKNTAKQAWLAQAAIFFAVINVIKLIPYTLNHVWTRDTLIASALLIPLAFVGVRLGYQLQAKLSQAQFVGFARGLLGLSGALLLLKSFF